MPPEAALPKRKPRENQYIFDLGVRGRKTGLTVADTGIRDENGLEPMDHLFSSPEKGTKARGMNGHRRNTDATISSEEDMEMEESNIQEPDAAISEQRRRAAIRMPPPHSKSPKKTFLQSPARRNPSLGPLSSPARGSIMVPRGAPESISVRRRLDFSHDSVDANTIDSSVISRSPQKRGNLKGSAFGRLGNNTQPVSLKRPFQVDDDYGGDDDPEIQHDPGLGNEGDSYQIDGEYAEDNAQDVEEQDVPESEPVLEPKPTQKPKGGPKAEIPAKKGRGRGRKKRDSDLPAEQEEEAPPTKRTRRSLDGPKSSSKPRPKGGPSKSGMVPATGKRPKPKATAKKTNLAPISETQSPQIQRGPPMPRNNRGLIILRRETPMEGSGFKQTRSGRNSIKPLAFWKNERIEYSEDENEYYNGGRFVLPRIKGVVRADEVEQPPQKKSYHKSSKGKKRAAVVESDEDDDEIEPWEVQPGRLVGEIRSWDPEDQTGVHAEEVEEEIALSSAAIITRDIAGASFRFAKTLTMPFFGSGMVDLPPGGVKKPKNSRKMQMVFFVFYGRVEVTVNDSTFRIGKGGMWQVPRGNFYSITNDYDKPARMFFAQGCEAEEAAETQ